MSDLSRHVLDPLWGSVHDLRAGQPISPGWGPVQCARMLARALEELEQKLADTDRALLTSREAHEITKRRAAQFEASLREVDRLLGVTRPDGFTLAELRARLERSSSDGESLARLAAQNERLRDELEAWRELALALAASVTRIGAPAVEELGVHVMPHPGGLEP